MRGTSDRYDSQDTITRTHFTTPRLHEVAARDRCAPVHASISTWEQLPSTSTDLTEEDVLGQCILTDPVQTPQYAQRRQAPP